jgi:uncharacterized protein YxjI
VIATVRQLFSPLRHRYEITLPDGSTQQATGSFSDMNWELAGSDRIVARISREWFKVRDTFGVEVEPGEDTALVLAIAICIDRLREERRRTVAWSG